ncbi:MAG: DNA polymerase III subunit beta [Defluviitaleaceae bacterium]|nr:DNA polymerase III subunit beta [Defluviitaleaceae bacterium]
MHILCSQNKIIKAINIAARAISSRTTMPILECFLLEANEFFKISANDLELAVETNPVEANIIEKGAVAINAKMFGDIIRRLPEDEVIIKVEENFLTYIKSGKAEFKLMGQNSDDFPKLPDIEKINPYVLAARDMRNIIRQTIFSISTAEDKPSLTGGLIETEEGHIKLITVDNFRISLRKEEILEGEENLSVIIPGKTLHELSRILPDQGNLKIHFSEKNALFEIEEGKIVSRLIEGEFLRYKQVLKQEYKTSFTVNQQVFLQALERSMLISTETRKTPVSFNIEKDKLIITSQAEVGNLYEELEISVQGVTPLEISFNPKYLTDIVKVMDMEYIHLNFSTSLSPCIIEGESTDKYTYLILPVRTS